MIETHIKLLYYNNFDFDVANHMWLAFQFYRSELIISFRYIFLLIVFLVFCSREVQKISNWDTTQVESDNVALLSVASVVS